LPPPFVFFLPAPSFLLTIATFRRIKAAPAIWANLVKHLCRSFLFLYAGGKKNISARVPLSPCNPLLLSRGGYREKKRIDFMKYPALVTEPYIFTRLIKADIKSAF
jgi:hypothetical protein